MCHMLSFLDASFPSLIDAPTTPATQTTSKSSQTSQTETQRAFNRSTPQDTSVNCRTPILNQMTPTKRPSPSLSGTKRAAQDTERAISPPPLKRKAQPAISSAEFPSWPASIRLTHSTESAVANFFTPASQKAKDRTTWTERAPRQDSPATLLVAKPVPEMDSAKALATPMKRKKIAAFDLVRTSKGLRALPALSGRTDG